MSLYKREPLGQLASQNKKKVKHFTYNHDDKIGKGYSSIVYKGTNELNNEIIAVKAIDMKGVKDSVSREMLDCQIQALTKLKHPNILKCHDVVRETSHCYIITEYCNEGDLSSHLKKKKRLTQSQVLKFMKDIVAGFIQMADKSFLHRDLKLANIFLNDGRALLADFGFAKKHCNIFEKEKYNVGSPLYMSPEALKRNIYSVKNDIWSIGIMLFQLLHGQTPWECKTEKQLMDKMVRIPVKFRDSLNISVQMKRFIKKCLQVNEDQRMSLSDLKLWNKNNTYQSLVQDGMNFLTNVQLIKQPFSSKQNGGQILGEIGNRVSSRSQSNFGYNSKPTANPVSRQNASLSGMQKDPKGIFNKNTIEKNNNILIQQINTFRLLYKIYQKLKKYSPQEKELSNAIGNEVIRRVTNLINVILPDKENINSTKGEEFGLTEIKNYLSEQTNSSIKKYKSVVKQYYKKYTSQISIHALGRQVTTKNLIRQVLTRSNFLKDCLNAEEMILIYWMIEFSGLDKDVKKEYLQGVIDPKNQIFTKNYLQQRINAL